MTPHVFVLDRDLRLRYEGAPTPITWIRAQEAAGCAAALDAVLAGRRPGPASTEPVGCSIKWRD